jgi:hypothetical protein
VLDLKKGKSIAIDISNEIHENVKTNVEIEESVQHQDEVSACSIDELSEFSHYKGIQQQIWRSYNHR